MTHTPCSPRIPNGIRRERACSIARRLLNGAGRAEFVAYRVEGQPTTDLLLHGLSSANDIIVAVNLNGPERGLSTSAAEHLDIRLDLTLESREVDVQLVAATVHLLGQLHWRTLDAHTGMLDGATIPAQLAELATSPGWRLGVVHADTIVVHDGEGTWPLAFAEVCTPIAMRQVQALTASVDWVAAQLGAELSQADLTWAVEAVRHGWLEGEVLSVRPPLPANCGFVDQVFWVDVDINSITLMRTGACDTAVVTLPIGPGNLDLDSLLRRARSALGAPEVAHVAPN